MYKKLSYIVVTFLSLFLIASNVNAKDVATCVYQMDNINLKHLQNAIVKVTLKENGKMPTIDVVNINGASNTGTYKIYFDLDNYDINDGASTSLSEELKKNPKKCPNHMLVSDTSTSSVVSYKAFLHYSTEEIEKIKTARGLNSSNSVDIPYAMTLSNNSCVDYLKQHIEEINKGTDNLTISSCTRNESKCKKKIESLETEIKNYEVHAQNCIKLGAMNANNTNYAKLKDAIKALEEKISDIKKNVDLTIVPGETRKIYVTKCGNVDNIPISIPRMTRGLYNLIKYLVPIVLIFAGMLQLFKAVVANDEKEMNNNGRKLIKSIIAGVLILLVMSIVQFVFGLIPDSDETNGNIGNCISCFINDSAACGSKTTLD